jgi:hypothetical protein
MCASVVGSPALHHPPPVIRLRATRAASAVPVPRARTRLARRGGERESAAAAEPVAAAAAALATPVVTVAAAADLQHHPQNN